MYAAINAWTFPAELPPEAQLAEAAQAGFGGVELVVGGESSLQPETPLERFAALGRQARELGMRVHGLATGLFWRTNYGASEAAERQAALELTRRLIDAARAAEATAVLVVPAVVGRWDAPAPQVGYADALNRSYEALVELAEAAEPAGVTLALENVWNRFLLSPLEFAELIDRVNSPYVAAYLDVGNVIAFGYPEDWIDVLGRRIARVHVKDYDVARPGPAGFCALGEGSVAWERVLPALRDAGYTGPLTYEGRGEPREICERLERLLTAYLPPEPGEGDEA